MEQQIDVCLSLSFLPSSLSTKSISNFLNGKFYKKKELFFNLNIWVFLISKLLTSGRYLTKIVTLSRHFESMTIQNTESSRISDLIAKYLSLFISIVGIRLSSLFITKMCRGLCRIKVIKNKILNGTWSSSENTLFIHKVIISTSKGG